MNQGFKSAGGNRRRRFGHQQLLDDGAFLQTLLERHESLSFTLDKIRVFDVGLQSVNNERRLAAVLAVGNPMSEHCQVRLDPTALHGGHAHIAQWYDTAPAYLRLQRFTSPEVFHNLRTHKTVGVVGLIRSKVGFDQAPFVKDQQGKTENSKFVSRQIAHAWRIGKRLFQLLVRQSPVGEPHHGVQNRPDVHRKVEVLQPLYRPAVAPAQLLQGGTRQGCGFLHSSQYSDNVVDADFACDRKVDVVE